MVIFDQRNIQRNASAVVSGLNQLIELNSDFFEQKNFEYNRSNESKNTSEIFAWLSPILINLSIQFVGYPKVKDLSRKEEHTQKQMQMQKQKLQHMQKLKYFADLDPLRTMNVLKDS